MWDLSAHSRRHSPGGGDVARLTDRVTSRITSRITGSIAFRTSRPMSVIDHVPRRFTGGGVGALGPSLSLGIAPQSRLGEPFFTNVAGFPLSATRGVERLRPCPPLPPFIDSSMPSVIRSLPHPETFATRSMPTSHGDHAANASVSR